MAHRHRVGSIVVMAVQTWSRADRLCLALLGFGVANHAILSILYADRGWTTAAGVAPFCLLACVLCVREGLSATRESCWRWALLASALLLWAGAWAALGYLTTVHGNYQTVKIDSLLSALRCVPLLLLLAPIGEGDEQPVFRLIDALQGLLSAVLMTAVLFPTWLAGGPALIDQDDILYHDVAFTAMAMISVTGLAIQTGGERRRLMKAVAILLVSHAILASFGNHLIVPRLDGRPGSIVMMIADLPFILFAMFLIVSRHRPLGAARLSDRRVLDIRLIGPACFTAFLMLLTFAVSAHSLHLAIFGGLATLSLYVIRSTVLQTLYLRSQAEIAHAANARAELLASISHDIRAPLCGVILNAQHLFRQEAADSTQKDLARQIHLGTDAVVGLLNDMLELARLDARAVRIVARPYDALQVAREAFDLVRPQGAAAGLDLRFTAMATARLPIIGDARRLRQVLVNLLANAVRFTPSGGTVALTVIAVGKAGSSDRRLRMTVTDTGVGIAGNARESLFDPFGMTGAPLYGRAGSGLGLMIAHRLMGLMGGSIDFESRTGAGSRFWIDLPVEPAGPAEVSRPRGRKRLNMPTFKVKPVA